MLKFQQKEVFMKKYFEILRKCPLFSGIKDEDITPMLGCVGARVVAYEKNETVIAEESAAREIGIVLCGRVRIIQIDYYGNRSILATAESGEIFGEAFACAGIGAVPVSTVSDEDSEIMFIDCMRVIGACSNACDFHRQLIYNLMKDLAQKNIMFHQKISVTSKRTTRDKLMTYLLIQAKKSGSNSFRIPYDRQELADYLEVERSGLSSEIGKLRREGIIENSKNHFELL